MPTNDAAPSHWWCPLCGRALNPNEVTFDEFHDARSCGCGGKAEWKSAANRPPSQPGQIARECRELVDVGQYLRECCDTVYDLRDKCAAWDAAKERLGL